MMKVKMELKAHHQMKYLIINMKKWLIEENLRTFTPRFFFRFCLANIKLTKNLGFHLNIKGANLQDLFYTTKGVDNNMNKKSLNLYIPTFNLDSETQ